MRSDDERDWRGPLKAQAREQLARRKRAARKARKTHKLLAQKRELKLTSLQTKKPKKKETAR